MGKILLVMGHQNTQGGDPEEMGRTPGIVNALEPALRAAGHAVHVLRREDGDANPNFTQGDRTLVGRRSRELVQQHGIQVLIDCHFQGTTNPTSGCFCVFPDWDGDSKQMNPLDVSFANRLALEVSSSTGIRRLPLSEPGGLGIMSERQTGVGEGGDRLGIFNSMSAVRTTCVRVVMEHGEIIADRAVIDGPQFHGAVGRAYLKAIGAFWPTSGGPTPVSPNGSFEVFPANRLFHTQASAIERSKPSVTAALVKKHSKGAEIVADGLQHAEQVFGDDLWIRTTSKRWIHRSGIVENPE